MEAKAYIKEYLKRIGTQEIYPHARIIYDEYAKVAGGEGATYNYFRTLYNNLCKNQNIKEPFKTPVEVKIEIEPVEKESINIFNDIIQYQGADSVHIANESIPTGTIHDSVICEEMEVFTGNITYKHNCLDCNNEPFYLEEKTDTCENCNSTNIEITHKKELITSTPGFVRGCVDVIAGKPGSGKTTSKVFLAAKAVQQSKKFNKPIKALFICGEMNESEWKREMVKMPLLKLVDVYYIGKHAGLPDYEERLIAAIASSDIVVADSFPIFISHIKMCKTEKRTEKDVIIDLINLFRNTAEKHNCNVQLINQANKDGNYKGGTELPHMTSSLSFVMVEEEKRYMIFRKNRNNGSTLNRKLFFSKVDGELSFDEDSYKLMYEQEHRFKDFENFLKSADTSLLGKTEPQMESEEEYLDRLEAEGTTEIDEVVS